MKTEYDVCEGFTIEELRNQVDLALEDGWQCQGGVSVTPYEDKGNTDPAFEKLIYHQAIIREIKENQTSDEELAELLNISVEQLPEPK